MSIEPPSANVWTAVVAVLVLITNIFQVWNKRGSDQVQEKIKETAEKTHQAVDGNLSVLMLKYSVAMWRLAGLTGTDEDKSEAIRATKESMSHEDAKEHGTKS